MADYTDLPNTAVGVGGIPSGTTVTALRDNPIAIAEGATGAPRVDPIAAMAHQGALGAVGTYAMLSFITSTSANPGTTHGGSDLRYQNAGGATSVGSSPSGTWRLMGQTQGVGVEASTSIFLRIS